MSRLSFDCLSTVFSYEATAASAPSAETDGGAGAFNDVLQRAQSEAGSQAESPRSSQDAARNSESNGPSRTGTTSSQNEETPAKPKPTEEESASSQTATESAETGEESAVAENGDANADDSQQDRPEDQDAEEAAAAAAVAAQPQPVVLPTDELTLSDAASAVAGGDAIPDTSTPAIPSEGTGLPAGTVPTDSPPAPPADVSLQAAQGQSTTESAPADSSGEAVEATAEQAVETTSATIAGTVVKQAADSPTSETESTPASSETSAAAQAAASAETAAAQPANDDHDSRRDKTRRAGQAAADSLQATAGLQTQSSAAVDSLPETIGAATAAAAADASALIEKTDSKDDVSADTSAADAGGDVIPTVRDSTANASTTASQGETQQTGAAGEGGQAERLRFIQRVARAFQSLGEDGGSVRLRLSPPELGSLRLEVTLRNGVMNAHVEADTPAARSLLLDNLPALRERLAEQNIKVENFDVDLTDQGTGGSWQQPSDQPSAESRQVGGGSRQNGQRESSVETAAAARTTPRYGGGSGFDVTI